MLIKYADLLTANSEITIEKISMEENASLRGAFSEIEKVTWVVNAPREFGVSGVLMRLNRDGKDFEDLRLSWNEDGTYTITLDMEKLGVGLYF